MRSQQARPPDHQSDAHPTEPPRPADNFRRTDTFSRETPLSNLFLLSFGKGSALNRKNLL